MKLPFTLVLLIAIATCLKPTTLRAQNANVNDSLALVALYDSTNGPGWANHTNWLTKKPLYTWFGVAVVGDRVISITLLANGLSERIPQALGNLTKLQILSFTYNQLNGGIPSTLGNLASLQQLYLDNNQLNGGIPSTLGNLASLQQLYLDNNQLSDSIPAALGGLTNLQKLILSNNKLSGGVPAALGSLASLQQLDLSYNQLSGSIPATLGSLTNLQQFNLSYNQLSGNIPTQLGSLINLQLLNLRYNQLNSIPSSLGNLLNLQQLALNNNQLAGSLPSTLGNLAKLQGLSLSNNQLSGSIPATLGNLIKLAYLDVSNNQLSDSIPSSLGSSKWTYLNISHNHLSGGIPVGWSNISPNTMVYLDDNDFTFNGIEYIVKNRGVSGYAPQYTILPVRLNNTELSVSAGGTLTNNTYKWYNGSTLVKTITGDSTYTATATGNYLVAVTNAVATQLTLYSDTFAVTAAELPVTFINFTAQYLHEGNLLQWQTASEINSAYFNVQRSNNGIQFTNIGQVNAAGSSTQIQSYQYTDAAPYAAGVTPSTVYYRIQELDKNGAAMYSKIISLNNNAAVPAAVAVYPSPVHNALFIQLNGISGKVAIAITSTAGVKLQTQQVEAVSGQTVTINTSSLAAGIYFVRVLYGNGQSLVQKVVKE